jgi:hypothetical protein
VVSLDLALTPSGNLCARHATATSVDVTVFDSDSVQVPAAATPPVQAGVNLTTTVTFTPMAPGSFHVTARFEPSLGLVQKDVLVAVDKSNEAPVVVQLPTAPTVSCSQIDFDGDTLLCLDTSNADNWLRTIRGAQVVSSVQATVFALSQGKVWLESPHDGLLDLYSLGADGTLTLVGSDAANTTLFPILLAVGDRVLVTSNTAFLEVRYLPDGGFDHSAPVPVDGGIDGVQWQDDAGVVVFAGAAMAGTVCGFRVSSPDGGCATTTDRLLGYDDDGVWWTDATLSLSGLLTLSVTGIGPSGFTAGSLSSIPIADPNTVFGSAPQSSPLLFTDSALSPSQLYVPHFDGKNVTLTRYPVATQAAHADSKRIWVQGTPETITWYPR